MGTEEKHGGEPAARTFYEERIDNIIEGLRIIRTYPGAAAGAHHDILCAGAEKRFSAEDCARLKELKWHETEHSDEDGSHWGVFT